MKLLNISKWNNYLVVHLC